MLAVKFHHLRALIHRPYLRLSVPQGTKDSQMIFLERAHTHVIDKEKICILSAQQTARLLRDITDERSLVLDFPWWQMISCLLCAGSILAVASSMTNSNTFETDLDSQALQEDTEICSKVFDSLSMYSHAARRARDMLQSLKHCCIQSQGMLILIMGNVVLIQTKSLPIFHRKCSLCYQQHETTSPQRLSRLVFLRISPGTSIPPNRSMTIYHFFVLTGIPGPSHFRTLYQNRLNQSPKDLSSLSTRPWYQTVRLRPLRTLFKLNFRDQIPTSK